jgi:hypothetical protein
MGVMTVYKRLCLMMCLSLQGCVFLTPSPELKALELVSTMATSVASLGPYSPDNQVLHVHGKIKSVCIEYNSSSEVADFVPSLQTVLADAGVDSRVYQPGGVPASCRYTMQYTAYMTWQKRAFGNEYSPCLTAAQIVMRENGKVIATSGYRPNSLGLDIWAPVGRKIEPAVRAILKANEGTQDPREAVLAK